MQNNIIEIQDNKLVISHRVIAELTQNQEKTISRLIRNHLASLELFGQVGFEIHTVRNSAGAVNEEKTFFLNEPQATLLLTFMRNNEIVIEFKVRLVQDFYTMKKILQNQQPKVSEKYEKVQIELLCLNNAIENLKVNEASKILMTETLYKDLGVNTNYLPKYSDENHSVSLSSLLKKFDVGISANKFNKLLIEKEFLEILTRKSSKTEENEKGEKTPIYKEFKSITKKGEEFGTNKVSTQNQLQTQPHYFENKFEELLEIVKIQKTLF